MIGDYPDRSGTTGSGAGDPLRAQYPPQTPAGQHQPLILPDQNQPTYPEMNMDHTIAASQFSPASPPYYEQSPNPARSFNQVPGTPFGSNRSPLSQKLNTGNLSASRPLRPEDMLRRPTSSLPPGGPVTKVKHLWHQDPAYKVLLIAVATVLLSGIICLVLVANLFNGSSGRTANQQGGPNGSNSGPGTSISTPTATPTPEPTPTPVPTLEPTPTPTPVSPTPTPTPVPDNGPLKIQVSGIPAQVQNNSTVTVTVTSNKPNVKVKLRINYTVSPFTTNIPAQSDNGTQQVTFSWNIALKMDHTRTATALVVATATDQNGQSTSSQPITVQVTP